MLSFVHSLKWEALIRKFTARVGRTNDICLPWTRSSLNTPGILPVYSYSQESNCWSDIFELFIGNGTDIVKIKAPRERWNNKKCRASINKHQGISYNNTGQKISKECYLEESLETDTYIEIMFFMPLKTSRGR